MRSVWRPRSDCAPHWNTDVTTTPPPSADRTRLAALQFVAALAWLACLAIVVHLHERAADRVIFIGGLAGVTILYPLFWAEAFRRWTTGKRTARWLAWCAALPILRIGLRDPDADGRIWLPRLGWRAADDRLVREVDHIFSGPMLLISIAVLPVVLVEFTLAEKLEANPRLAQLTALATAVIWWSFTVEFVLMVSVTSKKLDYCKRHWLDLVIILLPLLGFLRALRLGRLLRLQTLGKTARMYKLRGVLMRTYRALLLVEAVKRLLHGNPEKRLAKLRRQVADHEVALEHLRTEIRDLESQLAAENPPASVAEPAADQAAA
jgi:hypothetical protein